MAPWLAGQQDQSQGQSGARGFRNRSWDPASRVLPPTHFLLPNSCSPCKTPCRCRLLPEVPQRPPTRHPSALRDLRSALRLSLQSSRCAHTPPPPGSRPPSAVRPAQAHSGLWANEAKPDTGLTPGTALRPLPWPERRSPAPRPGGLAVPSHLGRVTASGFGLAHLHVATPMSACSLRVTRTRGDYRLSPIHLTRAQKVRKQSPCSPLGSEDGAIRANDTAPSV